MTRQPPTDRPTARAELRVAVIDDEPLARRGMRRLVARQSGYVVVGEANTGRSARDLILSDRPDIVLLDVQMPDGSGLEAIRGMPAAERPVTVFVTAHDNFAVDAFGVRAVDYVLKPFTDSRLIEALEHARESHAFRAGTAPPPTGGHIVVRSVGRTDVVYVADIVWIEAVGYYARLHTARAALLHRESLESLAARLDAAVFVRIHRGAIVRLDAVRHTTRLKTGSRELTLSTGHRVPVSRAGWTLLRDMLGESLLAVQADS